MRRKELKELFKYSDGRLTRLTGRVGRKGTKTIESCGGGYIQAKVNGKRLYVHRLVWELHHDSIPEGMVIDHINNIKDDNRIENLRCVSIAENNHNRQTHNNNTSGYKGVNRDKGKWRARVAINGKRLDLGLFDTPEQAHKALVAKRAKVKVRCIVNKPNRPTFKAPTKPIDAKYVRDNFKYIGGGLERLTGVHKGQQIKSTGDGYVKMQINGKLFTLHRIIWAWHNGKIPKGRVIDHINNDRNDNRIENLRAATEKENASNRKVA